tara:strand:- start:17 stop:502 length:486 start_codon:yes stop_codon:yes gene_type:complete
MKQSTNLVNCIILLTGIAVADETLPATDSVDASKTSVYCPLTKDLVKDSVSGKWSAPGGWYSQAYSFAKKVDNYLGAAYTGKDIGRIDCYYSSIETGDVRIVLKNTVLVTLPAVDSWQPSPKAKDVKVCQANAANGCPFVLYQETGQIKDLQKAIMDIPKS